MPFRKNPTCDIGIVSLVTSNWHIEYTNTVRPVPLLQLVDPLLEQQHVLLHLGVLLPELGILLLRGCDDGLEPGQCGGLLILLGPHLLKGSVSRDREGLNLVSKERS